MKRILTIAAVLIGMAGAFYLAASFITMEFNPSKWQEVGRFVCIMLWGIVSAAVIDSYFLTATSSPSEKQ